MVATFRVLVLAALGGACAAPAAVQCLYVLDGGRCHTTDLSRWTPGENSGVPWVFANHCYLIRHASGWLLWDSGFDDAIAQQSDGVVLSATVRIHKERTLASQLAELGVAPADVSTIAFSHFHIDHVGNASLFPAATLCVQAAEFEAAFGPSPQQFGFDPALCEPLRQNPKNLLQGDHDVFGDGAVVILSTPGHTPGHQSLLVRLPESGPVILSGDVAHLRANWTYRRAPATNWSMEQSLRSMQRIAEVMAATGAQIWIHHEPHDGPLPERVD